ncbi:MAG: hypothetical protein IJC64_01505 [Clostridia bacterium]|nr:hypothetical protein [Clostridia bacterium]
MNVLTQLIRLDREYGELCELVGRNLASAKSLPIVASGLSGGAQDALILSLTADTQAKLCAGRKRAALVICSEEKECQRLCREYGSLGYVCTHYVGRDLTFYNVTASHEFEHERLYVLSGLLEGRFDFVFTTPEVALGYTIPR